MIILAFLLMTIPVKGILNVYDIKEQTGFTEIQLNKVDVVSKTNMIIHVINAQEILDLINDLSTNIDKLHEDDKQILLTELKHLKNKVKTLISWNNRQKRGLINVVGSAQKWLFGTMDEKDRLDIEDHFKILDINNQDAITTLNQQVIINENFNKTFKQLKNIIEKDRKIILEKVNSQLYQYIYYDQIFKIQLLKGRIEHIQDNIASARYGIFHPNILTDEEIQKYNIDFNKMKYIKLGVTKFENDMLIFAIKIPKEFVKVQLRMILPMANNEQKEIDYPKEIVFKYNEKMYQYEDFKNINELSISKHCVYEQNCKLIKNNNTEIIEIDEETIVIKNGNELNITHNCDERKLIIKRNALIHFNKCDIKVKHQYFSNIKEIIHERFYYPANQTFENFTNKITLEEIVLEHTSNINKIEKLQYHKNVTYGISLSLILISIIVIFGIIFYIKKKPIKIKIDNRIQENSNSKGREVTYKSEQMPDKYDNLWEDITKHLPMNPEV